MKISKNLLHMLTYVTASVVCDFFFLFKLTSMHIIATTSIRCGQYNYIALKRNGCLKESLAIKMH